MGLSLELDGMGDYVEAVGYKGILGKDARSVSLWIKGEPQFRADGTTPNAAELVHWGDGRTATKRFTLRVNSDAANRNEFRVDVNGAYTYGSTNIVDNKWHHLVVVHHGDSALKDTILYVDGQPELITGGGTEIATVLNTLSYDNFRVGGTGTTAFTGLIDAVILFDRALTPDQVASLHSQAPIAVTADATAVNADVPGTYTIDYSASNEFGTTTATREVVVRDAIAPVITLVNGETVPVELGKPFTDPGATAVDNVDGDVPVTSSLDFPATGLIAHWKLDEGEGTEVSDASGNEVKGTVAGGVTIDQEGRKEERKGDRERGLHQLAAVAFHSQICLPFVVAGGWGGEGAHISCT